MFILKLFRSSGPFLRDLFIGDQTVLQALGSNKAKVAMALLLSGFVIFNSIILGHISAMRKNYTLLSKEYISLNTKYEAAEKQLKGGEKVIPVKPAVVMPVAEVPKPAEPVEVKKVEKKEPMPVVVVISPKPKKTKAESKETEKRYLELKRQYDKIKAREEKTD